jgi:(p)ppGpp synthase/HD superfamily hydrolase
MNQAQCAGYSDNDLGRLAEAFELALEISDGIYRMQGVPLLNHLVTNASILIFEQKRLEIVIAGLLHASYVLHRFQDSLRSCNLQARRKELKLLLGTEIEELIWSFDHIPWYSQKALETHLEQFEKLTQKQRDVLVLRLANEVDDYLDNSAEYALYGRNGYRSDECLGLCIELAARLEVASIHRELVKIRDLDEVPPSILVRGFSTGYEIASPRWKRGWLENGRFHTMRILRRLKRATGSGQ